MTIICYKYKNKPLSCKLISCLLFGCFHVALYLRMDKEKVAEHSQFNGDQELIDLGRRIRALRIAKGYKSAEKFALDYNLSRVHYGRWEAGKKNITYKSLLVLARAHGMTLSEFLAIEI